MTLLFNTISLAIELPLLSPFQELCICTAILVLWEAQYQWPLDFLSHKIATCWLGLVFFYRSKVQVDSPKHRDGLNLVSTSPLLKKFGKGLSKNAIPNLSSCFQGFTPNRFWQVTCAHHTSSHIHKSFVSPFSTPLCSIMTGLHIELQVQSCTICKRSYELTNFNIFSIMLSSTIIPYNFKFLFNFISTLVL